MKFIVSSSALLKQLSHINGVITTNPVVPILENFLFEIKKGTLTVTASDLQTSMITELEVEARESGSLAVPAKILIETLRNLPEQPVTFSIDQDHFTLEISSDNGRYKLSCENAIDFPKLPVVADGISVDMTSDALAGAIGKTIFATSNDELRPAMTGVYMSLDKTHTTFVATDGHRLIRYQRLDVVAKGQHSIIIPRKALNLLRTTLPSDNVTVTVEFNQSNAFFHFRNIKMICRLIDERYPDYQNVIPLDNDNHVAIARQELISSLKRISIYANRTTNQVRFRITGSEIQISAEDLDFANEASERLACEHDGEDIEIGFNARFMLEMLNNMDGDEVVLQLSEPNRAGLIVPKEAEVNENTLMLIMPVMLTSYV